MRLEPSPTADYTHRVKATQPNRPRRDVGSQAVPTTLRAFAWNLGQRVGPSGQKQVALNVIERGRAWHWSRLPKGWFDLEFCLRHGQRRTRAALRALFPAGR